MPSRFAPLPKRPKDHADMIKSLPSFSTRAKRGASQDTRTMQAEKRVISQQRSVAVRNDSDTKVRVRKTSVSHRKPQPKPKVPAKPKQPSKYYLETLRLNFIDLV